MSKRILFQITKDEETFDHMVKITEHRKWASVQWKTEIGQFNLDPFPSPLNLSDPTQRILFNLRCFDNFFFISDCIRGPLAKDPSTEIEFPLNFHGEMPVKVKNIGDRPIKCCCVLFAPNGEVSFLLSEGSKLVGIEKNSDCQFTFVDIPSKVFYDQEYTCVLFTAPGDPEFFHFVEAGVKELEGLTKNSLSFEGYREKKVEPRRDAFLSLVGRHCFTFSS